MFTKKILSAAIASIVLTSSAAFAIPAATIDLDANTGAVKYAKEALLTTQVQTVNTNSALTYYKVTASGVGAAVAGAPGTPAVGTETSFHAKIGIGFTVGSTVYVRIDLTGAVFSTAAVAGDLSGESTNITAVTLAGVVAQGGAIGDDYVIYGLTAPAGGFNQTDILTFTTAGLALSSDVPVKVTYAVYGTPTGALTKSTNQLVVTPKTADIATVVTGFASALTSNTITADVETSFKDFTPTGVKNIGRIELKGDVATRNRTSTLVTTNPTTLQQSASTTVDLSGDFSVGTWHLSSGSGCSAGIALYPDAAKTALFTDNVAAPSVKITGTQIYSDSYLCVVGNNKSFKASTVTATLTYAGITNTAFPATALKGSAGVIIRNGTTLQVPYLTTYHQYKQRLTLVNRSTAAADYTIDFTPEAGVTALRGTAATGTLAAHSTKVLSAADIVTLTGATRTAATITIVAPTSTIDAATTIVNTITGEGDTVILAAPAAIIPPV